MAAPQRRSSTRPVACRRARAQPCRRLQEARSFTCPTFFFFHVGNAFESEDGTSLCVDLAAYDDPAILNDLLLEPLRRPALAPDGQLAAPLSPSAYKRLTIPLTGPAGGRLQVRRAAAGAGAAGRGARGEVGAAARVRVRMCQKLL